MAVLVASAAQPDNPPGARAREGPEGDIPPFSSLPERMGGCIRPVRVPEFGAEPHQPSLGVYRISQRFVSDCFEWLFRDSGVIGEFKRYLHQKRGYRFRLIGKDRIGDSVVREIPYIHRWTEIYQKSVLAKFYQLDKWMIEHPSRVTHFTLTVYQSSKSEYNDGSFSRKVKGYDLTYQDSLDLLLVSRKKLLDVIRHRYPGVNYVWVMEAHKTGYPHCHLLVFRGFSEEEQNGIKNLWSSKYQAGSRDRGVEVTSSGNSEEILSMKNYLMKYMDKQFSVGNEGWTKGDWLFNAMMHKTRTRMWGTSKELTAVMKRPDAPDSGIVWDTVELLVPGYERVIWQRKDGESFPVLDDPDIQDPDDLCPESAITKQIWETKWDRLDPSRLRYRWQQSHIGSWI